jgi:DNA-binding FrmR family transcriptional regulator
MVSTRENVSSRKRKTKARRPDQARLDSIERSLSTGDYCADILMLLANVRGCVNSLMAGILKDQIRLHMMRPDKAQFPSQEIAEDLIDLVRAYLK